MPEAPPPTPELVGSPTLAVGREEMLGGGPTQPYEGPAPPPPEALPRGALVGRYIIVDLLGAGGMAVVHSAYDPTLNRKVAIKVLARGTKNPQAGKGRLMREAQAMAHVRHPNVVTVHDVGTYGDRVFLAMELIEGRSLRSWLAEKKRTVAEVIDVLVRAGRGLAAAHRAGIVHRDFKPDNVLVGDDGEVRVADFGLARAAVDSEEDASVDAFGSEEPSLAVRLTRTGALIGTPLYMAPEQHERQPSDARSDQFSFCVTLYEALWGKPPFGTGTIAALGKRVLAGELATPPPRPRVPGFVTAAIVRGLSVDPDERFPSMEALLAVLARDREVVKRRSWVAGVAIAGACLGALGVTALGGAPADRCAGAAEPVAAAWHGGRRAAVRAAFVATGKPFAGAVADDVTRAVDGYAEDLAARRRAACRAGAHGEQSAEAVDLRMACLERRQAELEALLRVFVDADAAVVSRAAGAAQSLEPLAQCDNVEELRAPARLPGDRARRAEIDAVRAQIDATQAARLAGKVKLTLPMARTALAAALATGYGPAIAEAYQTLGIALFENDDAAAAEATLEAALYAAEAARQDRMVAAAAIHLVRVVSFIEPRLAEARRWARLAAAATGRLGDDPELTLRLEEALGRLDFNRGAYSDATVRLRRAVELAERTGVRSTKLADIVLNLAEALNAGGQYDEAEGLYDRVLALQVSQVGPDHPDVAWTHKSIGTLHAARGRWSKARASYAAAAEIVERAVGPEAMLMASVMNNLADVELRVGAVDDAVVHLGRALEIWKKKLGEENPKVAIARHNLGNAYRMTGRLAEARAELGAARRIIENAFGIDHVRAAGVLASTAELELAAGNVAEAGRLAERALAIAERGLGAESVELAAALHAAAGAKLAAGDAEGAVAGYEKELGILEKAYGTGHAALADTMRPLAVALRKAGRRGEAEEVEARLAGLGR